MKHIHSNSLSNKKLHLREESLSLLQFYINVELVIKNYINVELDQDS